MHISLGLLDILLEKSATEGISLRSVLLNKI